MTEVEYLALPKTVKKDLKIGRSRVKSWEMNNFRPILSTNLPFCFRGATPPRPDPSHTPSVVGGVFKRFGYGTPTLNRAVKRRFRRFVSAWLKHNINPLTDADIPSFEEWIAATPYSEGRKSELRRVWAKFCAAGQPVKEFHNVKSFIKDETYPEFKYPRIINSRIDAAKCYFGPRVQAVSDVLFKRSEFIKTVPVPDRPAVIRDTLMDSGFDEDYVFTDYTAFEAHFIPEVMEITQFMLFQHMLKNCADSSDWMHNYKTTMGGMNVLKFKDLSAKILGTRMSGEMDTSLSNGFANLMLFLFVCKTRGAKAVGFVEGDDGLFKVSPSRCAPTTKDFADLGFTIKIEHTAQLSEASFCGQVYDMTDLIVITDPREVLARLGWTNKKYVHATNDTRMQLLRAKAFSLVYQYNGCPLLSTLGRRLLDLTDNVSISEKVFTNLDQWERSKLRAATTILPDEITPGDNTRQLVQKLYGITVVDQLKLEDQFRTIELGTHDMPVECPEPWVRYYDTYHLGHKNTDPCWLNKQERPFLKRLSNFQSGIRFVKSL